VKVRGPQIILLVLASVILVGFASENLYLNSPPCPMPRVA
jgi:hypothetical protein